MLGKARVFAMSKKTFTESSLPADSAHTSTIIIGAHRLLREGLTSLLSNYSYRVIGAFDDAHSIHNTCALGDGQILVLLGSAPGVITGQSVVQIRHFWPSSRIVVLLEKQTPHEIQTLLEQGFDGCIPLFASREMLVGMLDLIVLHGTKLIVLPNNVGLEAHEETQSEYHLPLLEQIPESSSPTIPVQSTLPAKYTNNNGHGRTMTGAIAKLSSRELQIVHALVKGYSNKLIARECEITEATVKVHMKSILRKIRVGNRTQVAVWAIENGLSDDNFPPLKIAAEKMN
jgi:two-component system nitrate/nitrite response regulator NarL